MAEVARTAAQALDSAKSAHHRIDRMEQDVQDIHALAETMAGMRQEMIGVKEDVAEIKANVAALSERPVRWWDSFVAAMIGAAGTGLATSALMLILK